MHVFVTGASGFVGSAVTRHLINAGHRVTGFARSDGAAAAIEAAGAAVLRGDLSDPDGLSAGAGAADAVVHTAFIHDFANFAASVEVEKRAIEALGSALAGTDKPFIMTSGIGLLASGHVATESDGPATTGHGALRGATETLALTFVERGVRVGIVRLPASVHGDGDHGFVPALIDFARKAGRSVYVGGGGNRWPAVHREDAARLYVLALEKGGAGLRHHAVGEEGIPFRALAEAIGSGLGVPTASVAKEEAHDHFGWMTHFAQFDVPASAELTQQRLGWQPTGPSLFEDLQRGSYFAG